MTDVNNTRDGFELNRDRFEFPEDFADLSRDGKRAAKVCDMFFNLGLSVERIMQFLHEDYGSIVKTLIAHRVVKDRRVAYGRSPSGQEQRSGLPAWFVSDADRQTPTA